MFSVYAALLVQPHLTNASKSVSSKAWGSEMHLHVRVCPCTCLIFGSAFETFGAFPLGFDFLRNAYAEYQKQQNTMNEVIEERRKSALYVYTHVPPALADTCMCLPMTCGLSIHSKRRQHVFLLLLYATCTNSGADVYPILPYHTIPIGNR